MSNIPQASQSSSDLLIQVQLEVVHNASGLKERRVVPPGQVYVLLRATGFLEVYRSGEVVGGSRVREDIQVIELAEYPGKITIGANQFLPAISLSEGDGASLRASFNIRLQDPLALLKRLGDKWREQKGRDLFHKEINQEIQERIEYILSSSTLQLWSGDERLVYERIFSPLDDELRMRGLCLDLTVHTTEPPFIAFRRYPPNLYNIALQFAMAERAVRYWITEDPTGLGNQTGFSQRDLNNIQATTDEEGVAFFSAVRQNRHGIPKIVQWLRSQQLQEAAEFVEQLYSDRFSSQEVALSEQVMFAAIRNPMLTIGEWLRESAGMARPTLFQRLRDRISALSG